MLSAGGLRRLTPEMDFTDGGYAGGTPITSGSKRPLRLVLAGCAINPLESAIAGIAKASADAEGLTALILQDHLSRLCEMQRQGLSENNQSNPGTLQSPAL